MHIPILNLAAAITAFAAGALLAFLSFKTRMLRRSMLVSSAGIFIALGIHSFVELLESEGQMDVATLLVVMPILVVSGSAMLVLSGLILQKQVTSRVTRMAEVVRMLDARKPGDDTTRDLMRPDDELAYLFKEILATTGKLQESKEKLACSNADLEGKVSERTRQLQQKNDELEKFFMLTVGREVKLSELKDKVRELEKKA